MAYSLCIDPGDVVGYLLHVYQFVFTTSGGGYNNLHQVHQLLLNDNLLFADWVLYLAVDLFTGFAIVKAAIHNWDYALNNYLFKIELVGLKKRCFHRKSFSFFKYITAG